MNKLIKIIFLLLAFSIAAPRLLHSNDFSMFYIEPRNEVSSVYKKKSNRFFITSEHKSLTLPQTPFQRTIKLVLKEKVVELVIETGLNEKYKESRKQHKKYLVDSRLLNLTSPKVKLVAKQFKKSKDKVKAVEQFVYHYILDKKIGIPLISAESILKMRAGDCTEHAVLSVAILRALKVPARAVMGLVLAKEFYGKKNVFVYHMWCEAFYKGRWQLIDATRPLNKSASKYIAFSYHSLQTVMTLEYAEASASIKNMKIKYLK
jgi:transglutaminase-like putative cysteine protease